MLDSDLKDEELFVAGLELLESRKFRGRFVYCISCGDGMRKVSGLNVCADCLDDECDVFYKHATDDDLEDEEII